MHTMHQNLLSFGVEMPDILEAGGGIQLLVSYNASGSFLSGFGAFSNFGSTIFDRPVVHMRNTTPHM